MLIKNEKPPNWDKIKARFDFDESNTCFAYGDTIYNPSGQHIPTDLLIHEQVHLHQQNGKPEEWWEQYLASPLFRLRMEVEAYVAQYGWVCSLVKDRNQRFVYLNAYANFLSSKMYGNLVSTSDARKLIRQELELKNESPS